MAVLSRQPLFSVVGFDGAPVGVVTLDLLARVPPAKAAARLDAVAISLPREYVAGPGDPALPLFDHRPLAGGLVAVAAADGRVCGMSPSRTCGG